MDISLNVKGTPYILIKLPTYLPPSLPRLHIVGSDESVANKEKVWGWVRERKTFAYLLLLFIS